MQRPYFLGIDLGSSAIKALALDEEHRVLARALEPTGLILEHSLARLDQKLAAELGGIGFPAYTVATGYGRRQVQSANGVKSEILCHARGVFHCFGKACTLIDIGGQDNKVIHIDEQGRVTHFRMNTKCAAGTGAFLEEIAAKAGLSLEELHELACLSSRQVPVNSFCTVFAMTEVLKRIMSGEQLADIARGIYLSVADRVREIYSASRADLVLTGGVVENNPLVLELLRERLGRTPDCPQSPQFSGALGAALFALDGFHEQIAGKSAEIRGLT